ncbi:hypothetical protein V1477_018705 [Vespula maculifrons]|uniref:Uncharacterized protein n=1 Tax=Vespula maculifrons TaxID=7453 RepID=A0ABD2AW52_VESMC
MKGINVGLDEQWSSVFITSNSEWFRFHDISDAANPTMQRINPFVSIRIEANRNSRKPAFKVKWYASKFWKMKDLGKNKFSKDN